MRKLLNWYKRRRNADVRRLAARTVHQQITTDVHGLLEHLILQIEGISRRRSITIEAAILKRRKRLYAQIADTVATTDTYYLFELHQELSLSYHPMVPVLLKIRHESALARNTNKA